MGLIFGLSPQSRPQACPPGQALKSLSPQCKALAQPKPIFYRPDPALKNTTTMFAIYHFGVFPPGEVILLAIGSQMNWSL
jgi:hypothetical protein